MSDSRLLKEKNIEIPLLVDLDGSVLKTDTTFESLLLFFRNHPLLFFLPFIWILRGRNVMKRELTKRTNLNIDSLPLRAEVVQYLNLQHKLNRKIILCTGSWVSTAQEISTKLGIFDHVIASDDQKNNIGKVKAQTVLSTWGAGSYDYLGNEKKDIEVWRNARNALVVGDQNLVKAAEGVAEVEKHFMVGAPRLKTWLKAIRLHQWSKNFLLFVPLVTAHKVTQVDEILTVVAGFLCFGLISSATYLVNDLLDLQSDREHAIKKSRPLAAGDIDIKSACIASFCLLLLGFTFSFLFLNKYFVTTISIYVLLTLLYSFKFKQLQTIDVIALASLFTIRVVAGGAAIYVMLSFWLLCFSMFLFLSLAMVKRVAELVSVEKKFGSELKKVGGRGYFTADLVILQCLGAASGFISVLVFSLYINSQEVIQLYSHPEVLWLMVPIIGYWIMRVWMLAARGQMNEDPIVFAITDWNSWLSAFLLASVLIVASIL